ncbi:PREDICTED: aspartyl protease family protein 2-like [Nelumbo nucifera]|nr:PREDICTED: aspartyl protease family protein 2-like [Nelumbo nucifera]
MIHRHHPKFEKKTGVKAPESPMERLQQLIRLDEKRIEMVFRMREHRRKVAEAVVNMTTTEKQQKRQVLSLPSSVQLQLYSGSYSYTNSYVTTFRVGTPPQRLLLITDTGSALTWANCIHNCSDCSRKHRRRRIFDADKSTSIRSIPCSSEMCQVGLQEFNAYYDYCPKRKSPCWYDMSYSGGTTVIGFFANETVTVKRRNKGHTRIHQVLIGCTDPTGNTDFSEADGIIGLGYSPYSFAYRAAMQLGGKFSYSLMDVLSSRNVSNYIVFGEDNKKMQMQYTELVLGKVGTHYALNVRGISVGGVMLDIPPYVWDVEMGYGAILDSGTSAFALPEMAYRPIVDALKAALEGYPPVTVTGLEYCVIVDNTTTFDESRVPKLVIHFADGATFEPPVKNYVINPGEGGRCLGFMPTPWPADSLIGSFMQQGYLWEFDLINGKLGYALADCT